MGSSEHIASSIILLSNLLISIFDISFINYIEEHLLDEKVIDEAMKRVSVSELHLKNVFFFLTGMSINEYVKNRRLSEANYDLLHGKK